MTTPAPAPRVLVVDDEAPVRILAQRVLRDAGYEVLVAHDGMRALDVVNGQGPFDLAVIDLGLPDMRGDALVGRLRETHPFIKVLYFSGDGASLVNKPSSQPATEAFLAKPMTIGVLRESVSQLLLGHPHGPGLQSPRSVAPLDP